MATNNFFDKAIKISTGFGLGAQQPLDSRLILNNKEELLGLPDIRKYVGMVVYLVEDKEAYRYTADGTWEPSDAAFIVENRAPLSTDGSAGDLFIDTATTNLYIRDITDNSTLESDWIFVCRLSGEYGSVSYEEQFTFAANEWTASGQVYTASKVVTSCTIDSKTDIFLFLDQNTFEAYLQANVTGYTQDNTTGRIRLYATNIPSGSITFNGRIIKYRN